VTTRRVVPEAVVFANYLRQGMQRRGLTNMDVGRAVGVSDSLVVWWRSAYAMPTLRHAEALAVVLLDERVRDMILAARTRQCAYAPCSRVFVQKVAAHRRYCSMTCKTYAAKNPAAKRDPRQDAIDAFCAACEPEGLCRTAECPLRGFSPLVFIPLHRSVA
jgi:hypothetical protein